MAGGILLLTDGTERVNMLGTKNGQPGIKLDSYRPGRIQMKKGGIWHDSPISDFRSLVDHRWSTIVDTFKYKVVGGCTDDSIYYGQEFDRLLIAGAEYWELAHSVKPVWIVRRGENETNTSYALLHGFKLPQDADPYKEPFAGLAKAIQNKMTIAIEHGAWLEEPPGQGNPTPAGAMMCNNHLLNPSFEDWTVGVPDDWIVYGVATVIENTNLDYIRTGAKSVGFDNISVTHRGIVSSVLGNSETHYIVEVDVYVVSGRAVLALYQLGETPKDGTLVASTGTGWQTLRAGQVGYPSGGALQVMIGTHKDTGGEVYFDDISACRYHGSSDWHIERAVPTVSADDCYVFDSTYSPPGTVYDTISLALATLYGGSDTILSSAYGMGIRFRAVDIPQGAKIRHCLIRMQIKLTIADDSDGTNLIIRGEDNSSPAIFSTIGDFNGRAFTSTSKKWNISVIFTDNQLVNTPNIAPIIEEIVGRPDWVSGNDIVIFILNNDSANGELFQISSLDDSDPEPEIHIVYGLYAAAKEKPLEEASTPFFVANKMNQANLTDIYVWTGTFTENLLDEVDDWDIHGGTAGNSTYFGITTAFANDGPFNSLVFNLKDYSDDNGGVNDIIWEYWNGAWVTLTVLKDWTDDDTNGPFSNSDLGVLSVHWEPPSDWVTTSINSITAWWVRARVNSVSGSYTSIAEQDRSDQVYTVTWPFIEVKDRNVGGDIPALAELIFTNKTDDRALNEFAYQRLVMGLRALDRGEDFNGFINISDVQQPPHIVTAVPGGDTSWATLNNAPTGRIAEFARGSAVGIFENITITIAGTHAAQYFGRFRIYMRVRLSGAQVFNRLNINLGGSSRVDTISGIHTLVDFAIIDFGEMQIPFGSHASDDIYEDLVFSIELGCAGAVTYYRVTDLILMPIDQAFYDFQAKSLTDLLGNWDPAIWTQLDMDSVRSPKRTLRALLQKQANDAVLGNWMHSANKPLALEANKSQRLWVVGWDGTASSPIAADPNGCGTARINHVQRYTGMRGNR